MWNHGKKPPHHRMIGGHFTRFSGRDNYPQRRGTRPIIATSGGWDPQAQQWIHLDYVPYALLRKKWQWHLLTMLRQTVKTPEIRQLVDTCYTRYREGFVTNVQIGDVPTRYQSLARYLVKYVVST